jgi:hypothetical protein
MKNLEPVFVTPRRAPQPWGRVGLGEWTGRLSDADGPVGEIWLHDAANATEAGALGSMIARDSTGMLGDLGRAPPRMRLVFPGQDVELASSAPFSFWLFLEPGWASDGRQGARRSGERIRAYEGAAIELSAGSIALEVAASFQPDNSADDKPSAIRLPPVSKRARATLVREHALSVETWLLPESSRLIPDGETCHVITALTRGVTLDGCTLAPGQAVFLPAAGRTALLHARRPDARVLIAYPDRTPTGIWRHAPGPDPMSGLMPRPDPRRPEIDAIARDRACALAA